jgi:hypothetical protein
MHIDRERFSSAFGWPSKKRSHAEKKMAEWNEMREMPVVRFRRRTYRYVCGCSLLMAMLLVGCGDSGLSLNTSTGENTSSLTPYVGVEPADGFFAGVWDAQLDHNTSYFSLTDADYDGLSQSFIGNFQSVNGFLSMNVTSSRVPFTIGVTTEVAYAAEHPGDGMLLHADTLPVVFAADSVCPTLTNQTYQFIEMAGLSSNSPSYQGYGHVTVNASASNWSFSNYDILGMDGTDQKPAALGSAACTQTAEGNVATMPVTLNGTGVTYTTAVSPSGLFVMDRDWRGGQLPLVGFAVPSSPLDTNALENAEYIGFEYDYFVKSPQELTAITNDAHFPGGPLLQGGLYPSNDLTQTPGSNITINLGTEDASSNGFYPAVSVTLPDTAHHCLSQSYGGTDSAGNPICTFPGVAVASSTSNKFDLFLTIQNLSDGQTTGGHSVIQFLLFQK